MAPSMNRASPGGLSRWPRILFLGAAAFALAVLVGRWAYGADKDVGTDAAMLGFVIFTVIPGWILARLASPWEANPRRTTGIWVALLSYLGVIAGLALWMIGASMWQGEAMAFNMPVQPGLVDSAAASLFAAGVLICMPSLLVFVPAGLYTLWAYWRTPHRELAARSDHAQRVVGGFEVGAAVTAALVAALGLTYALFWHNAATPALPAWSDEGRALMFGGGVGIVAILVVVGTGLHVRGDRWATPGRALLWIGAGVLTVAGVLDSFSATSLSGTTGTYAVSADGENAVLLNHWIGLGTFLFPAAVLALLLAINVTHIHLPRQLHLPHYHRHAPTVSAT